MSEPRGEKRKVSEIAPEEKKTLPNKKQARKQPYKRSDLAEKKTEVVEIKSDDEDEVPLKFLTCFAKKTMPRYKNLFVYRCDDELLTSKACPGCGLVRMTLLACNSECGRVIPLSTAWLDGKSVLDKCDLCENRICGDCQAKCIKCKKIVCGDCLCICPHKCIPCQEEYEEAEEERQFKLMNKH
jgi:hypothetical protein